MYQFPLLLVLTFSDCNVLLKSVRVINQGE
jgi:hypothetical protein